ncbi:heme biosynthesis protein HemY [Listeria rocourtiae]|uniref:hypothetical protein n=1 Tax=Listeria rocourtiae TaxID=647910 RepID=UPI001629474E|nr:hypothetical protein [Listeria rocourtiae]MBC1604459.1 heme biosynthesis protein HemY [Listeria rocourtiae]
MDSDKIAYILGIFVAALVILAIVALFVGLVVVTIAGIRNYFQEKKKKRVKQRMLQTIYDYFPNCEKIVETYKDDSFTVYADGKEHEVILSDDGTKVVHQKQEYIFEDEDEDMDEMDDD